LFGLDDEQQHELFEFDLDDGQMNAEEILRILRQFDRSNNIQTSEKNFPLSIFSNMDIENSFSDDN
jgi:hypothetical protein